jgi:hypothetical protein
MQDETGIPCGASKMPAVGNMLWSGADGGNGRQRHAGLRRNGSPTWAPWGLTCTCCPPTPGFTIKEAILWKNLERLLRL